MKAGTYDTHTRTREEHLRAGLPVGCDDLAGGFRVQDSIAVRILEKEMRRGPAAPSAHRPRRARAARRLLPAADFPGGLSAAARALLVSIAVVQSFEEITAIRAKHNKNGSTKCLMSRGLEKRTKNIEMN